MCWKKEIIKKIDHLLDLSGEVLNIEQFEWFFEVFIFWCIIKNEDEVEDLILKCQKDVEKYLESKGVMRKNVGYPVHGSTNDKIH